MPAKGGWSAVKSSEKVEIEKLSTSPYPIRAMRVTRQARINSRTLVSCKTLLLLPIANLVDQSAGPLNKTPPGEGILL
jgi:hypothetical protein